MPLCHHRLNESLGMRFGEPFYYCIECNIDLCPSCQGAHAVTEHASSLVRITIHFWPPRPDVAKAAASCSECSLETKCRLECSDCLQCICSTCFGVPLRRLTWLGHRDQHQRPKGFINIVPPSQNVVPPASRECECLTVTGCIGHCGRCYQGMLYLFNCAIAAIFFFHFGTISFLLDVFSVLDVCDLGIKPVAATFRSGRI